MTWLQAVILGMVEGLTEYLPVSSTGHLLLAQRAMGIAKTDASDAFAIAIQAGAIVAVLGLYWRRVVGMAAGVLGRDAAGARLAVAILSAFLPAAFLALALEKPIKAHLFGLWPVVAAWFVGGVAILAVSGMRPRRASKPGLPLDALTWKMALVIGFAQCVAMWPGVSRSLVTIVGGVLVGLSLPAAVEFSFLLGVVTLGAATAYDALRHGAEMVESYGLAPIAAGFLSAWISAVVAVRWMVGYLQRHGMQIFGWYRIAIALGVAALLATGKLSP